MARFKTNYSFDMKVGVGSAGGEVPPGHLIYAGADRIVSGTALQHTVYEGSFTYSRGASRGEVESLTIVHDGAEIWSLKRTDIPISFFDAGEDVEDIFRWGLDGNDKIYGSSGPDRLLGYTGKDLMSGKAGNDVLHGGDGRDTLLGGSGADRLTGGPGRDRIEGGDGNDIIVGAGDDHLIFDGSDGTDRVLDFRADAGRIKITDGADRFSDLDIDRVGDDVRIAFADTVIILEDTTLRRLGAEDFFF